MRSTGLEVTACGFWPLSRDGNSRRWTNLVHSAPVHQSNKADHLIKVCSIMELHLVNIGFCNVKRLRLLCRLPSSSWLPVAGFSAYPQNEIPRFGETNGIRPKEPCTQHQFPRSNRWHVNLGNGWYPRTQLLCWIFLDPHSWIPHAMRSANPQGFNWKTWELARINNE